MYRPQADGTYKKAGDFLKEYVLENDNGDCNFFFFVTLLFIGF